MPARSRCDQRRRRSTSAPIAAKSSASVAGWEPRLPTAHPPLTALKLAISDVGPSFKRDSVDERMITELISWGTLGGTITSELLPPMNGPRLVRNGTPYPDGDNDGMPDFWENGTSSNPAVPNHNDPSPSGSGTRATVAAAGSTT